MNVFTPLPQRSSTAALLPVMLFIHGGNFQFSDASIPIYEAERLVNDTNVVVALIQYRLGKCMTNDVRIRIKEEEQGLFS